MKRLLLAVAMMTVGCSKPTPATVAYTTRYSRKAPNGELAGLTLAQYRAKLAAIRADYHAQRITEQTADYAIAVIRDRRLIGAELGF